MLKPAGFDHAQGIVSAAYLKDATDPQWKNDADMKAWNAFMDKYMPDGDKSDCSYIYGYSVSRTMVQVLKQCGDDLTRENIMKQAASSQELRTGASIARNCDQYEPDRLCADRTTATDEVRRSDLETVR